MLVTGNYDSPMFPQELLPYTTRQTFGKGGIKVNFLVNYGWEWDLSALKAQDRKRNVMDYIKSRIFPAWI